MYLTNTTQRLSELGSSLSVKLDAKKLFVSIAGTVGKPCITTDFACIHDGFVYFPDLKINSLFLYSIFDAGEAYKGLGKMGTQLNLNTDTVGEIKIALPPSREMEKVIAHIEIQKDIFQSIITKAECSIKLMQERRTALISAAVTGKIDVRNWQPAQTEIPMEASA
jgi:type I restriction enzyme S subunit